VLAYERYFIYPGAKSSLPGKPLQPAATATEYGTSPEPSPRMPDATLNAMPNPLLAGVEPASDEGIGVAMQDLATPVRASKPLPQAEAPEFDAWLRRHLSALHAGVLTEPVPDRFLRLLDGLAG
jgi:hypothetical protein